MRDARDVVHGVARPRAAATSGAGACRPPAETPGLAVFGRDIVRSRPATEHRLACPQPCPELGNSDPTQPHLDEQKDAQTNIKALPIEHFKTGRPWQPQGWKVRFLRRSALGTPLVQWVPACARARGRAGRSRPGPHQLRPEGFIPPTSARGLTRELPCRAQPPTRAQDALQREQRLVATRAPITSRRRGALSLSPAEASIFRASDDTLGPRPMRVPGVGQGRVPQLL